MHQLKKHQPVRGCVSVDALVEVSFKVLIHLLKRAVLDSDDFSSLSGGSLAFLEYMYN